MHPADKAPPAAAASTSTSMPAAPSAAAAPVKPAASSNGLSTSHPSSTGTGNGNAHGNSAAGNGTAKNKKKSRAADKGKQAAAGKTDVAAPPPGFARAAGKATTAMGDDYQRLLRHRALFAFRVWVGKLVDAELRDGSRYAGVLDCVHPDDFQVVLRNSVYKGDRPPDTYKKGATLVLKREDVVQLVVEDVVDYSDPLGQGLSGSFRTDTEISGQSHTHLYGRELEMANSWLDPSLDTGDLEEDRRRNKTPWNQFEVNEKLFGVVSTFDENLYTTKLDKTKFSNAQSREAERIAREIERQTTNNFHLQEERGQSVHRRDLDEEALYSSVDRRQEASTQASRRPNAYVPPALRNNAQRPVNGRASTPTSDVVAASTTSAQPSAGSSSTAHTAVTQTVEHASEAKPADDAPAAPVSKTSGAQQTAATTPSEQPTETPTPAASSAPPQRRAPLSFSEAVTGRAAAAKPPATRATATEEAQSKKQTPTARPAATPATDKASTTKTAPAKSPVKKQPQPSELKKTTEPAATSTPAKPSDDKQPTDASSEAKAATTTPAPAKKGLNPNAKEFKLSASAAEFTPKFMTQEMPASPYRHGAPYGMPGPPHAMAAPMGYGGMPEEWMYEGVMMEDGEYGPPAMMGYGMPMMSMPPMMQQPMYPPMVPQQGMPPVMAGGQRGGHARYPAFGHPPRGYYGQPGVPGMMYPGSPGEAMGGTPPPLPSGPTPGNMAQGPGTNRNDVGDGSELTDGEAAGGDAPSAQQTQQSPRGNPRAARPQ